MLSGCELCGFNVGQFEERIVSGQGESEVNVIPFRLQSDLALVLNSERKLLSLADFLHGAVTIHGIAEFELSDHVVSPKQRPGATWLSDTRKILYVNWIRLDLTIILNNLIHSLLQLFYLMKHSVFECQC